MSIYRFDATSPVTPGSLTTAEFMRQQAINKQQERADQQAYSDRQAAFLGVAQPPANVGAPSPAQMAAAHAQQAALWGQINASRGYHPQQAAPATVVFEQQGHPARQPVQQSAADLVGPALQALRGQPVQRSYQPPRQAPVSPVTGRPSGLTAVIRRSVGIIE